MAHTGSVHDFSVVMQCMVRLADEPELRRKMGAAERQKYDQLFTPQAVLPMLLNLYERIIDKHAAINRTGSASGNGHRRSPELHPWFND